MPIKWYVGKVITNCSTEITYYVSIKVLNCFLTEQYLKYCNMMTATIIFH